MANLQTKVKILVNKKIGQNYWHLEFLSEPLSRLSQPGQFIDIKVNDTEQPLLRRPISIHGISGSKIRLLYEILGQGTQALAQRKPNELLDILGPLGKGFNWQSQNKGKSKAGQNILVAGGMGVAPLVFLAQRLNKPLVLIGGQSKKNILCLNEFKKLGCAVELATLDGSVGFKGRVTELLKNVLIQVKAQEIFSCGPQAMLKVVANIAQENQIKAQLSLESHMACGIGACLGCVVGTKSGYRRVCKDGPVFSSEELIW